METAEHGPASEEEIAEVIDLIDELAREGDPEESLALSRSVAELANTPQLALHGILRLIEARHTSDHELVVRSLREIAGAHPDTRWILFRCGYHLGEIGLTDEAIDCYERSIAIKPTARSHLHVARLLHRRGDITRGIEHLDAANTLSPDNEDVRAELLWQLAAGAERDRFDTLASAKGFDDAYLARCEHRLGEALLAEGRRRQALMRFDRALELAPDSFPCQWSKQLTPTSGFRNEDDLGAGRQQYLAGLERIAEVYDSLNAAEKDRAYRCTELRPRGEVHAQPDDDVALRKPLGALVHRVMSHAFPRYMKPLPRRHPGNARRLRVGFASAGCFLDDAIHETHAGWITGLDQERFEVFGYSLSGRTDAVSARMAVAMEHFVPFGGDIAMLCQRIAADELDVMVYPEVGRDPVVNRLSPLRLAPVQCAGWAYPVTTGLPNIDYFLSSVAMEPEDGQAHYTETLVQLPGLGIVYQAPDLARADARPLPALLELRPRAGAVFWCAQDPLHLLPQHDYLFARILQGAPDSEIRFSASPRRDVNRAFKRRMKRTCESYGVDFDSRCLLLPAMTHADTRRASREVDVLLEPGNWSDCSATLLALSRSIPVVTLPGDNLRGRGAWAILRHHGLGELCAGTGKEYVALAIRLAAEEDFYHAMVERIAGIGEDLGRDDGVIRALEGVFDRALTGDL